MNTLTIAEPIMPIRDPANPPSLPAWLTSRLAMVSREGRETRLPANCPLSQTERNAIEAHRKALDAFCHKTSLTDQPTANLVLGAVTRLLIALPAKAMGEIAAEARGDAYMIALEDIPHWAIEAAIRGWYRGEHPGDHDFRWAPAPAILRDLARRELWKIKGRSKVLGDLLDATPLVEYSDEHRQEMLGKLKGLFVVQAS